MVVDDETVADIRRGVTRLAGRLRAERPVDALSSNKINVLAHLFRSGPSTPKEIALAEHQHPQSLTRVFAELEAAELISRRRSDRDRRASVLALTESGRATLTCDMMQRDVWLAGALTRFTPAEVALLRVAAGLMDKIVDAPEDPQGGGPGSEPAHRGVYWTEDARSDERTRTRPVKGATAERGTR